MTTRELARYIFNFWEIDANIPLSSELIDTRVFDAVGTYDTNLYGAGDRDLFARAFKLFDVACLDDVLAAKRYHDERASHSTKLLQDRRQMTEKLIQQYPFLEQYRRQREAFISLAFARSNLYSKDLSGCLREVASAFSKSPIFSVNIIKNELNLAK
jgi:hypothetical protein